VRRSTAGVWGQELGPSRGYSGMVPPHRHPDKTVASPVWADVATSASRRFFEAARRQKAGVRAGFPRRKRAWSRFASAGGASASKVPRSAWASPGVPPSCGFASLGRFPRRPPPARSATGLPPSRRDAVFAARTAGIGATETSSVPGTSPPGATRESLAGGPPRSRISGPGDGPCRRGRHPCEDRRGPERTRLGLMRRSTYDLLVGWYLWVVAIVLVLALIALGAILVQRWRRSGGVVSVRPRPKRRRQ
jgi:hypothetical protein